MACQGDIFVLSAPSGTGKSTFVKRLFADIDQLSFSVSYTTRAPREGETDGQEYFFVDDATFDGMLAENNLVEWVQVYQHRYGTGRSWIHDQINNARDVLLDLETEGAKRVKEIFPEAILIFLLPPSAKSLSDRLKGRGKDTDEQVSIRLQSAKREIDCWDCYDYLILNDNLESAYQDFKAIFLAARTKKKHMGHVIRDVLATF